MRRIISVSEKVYAEICKQGLPFKQLFYAEDWETNLHEY